MQKIMGFLVLGIILIVLGGMVCFFVQQPFTDCPSYGADSRYNTTKHLDKCQISGNLQITGSSLFVIGIGFVIYGSITKYSI